MIIIQCTYLREAALSVGNKQHMAIVNWTHINYHQVFSVLKVSEMRSFLFLFSISIDKCGNVLLISNQEKGYNRNRFKINKLFLI